MTRRTSTLLMLTMFLPYYSMAKESIPPPSVVIYETLERLWSGRQYEQLTAYLGVLESSYGDYVPVQVARAIYCYKYGAQVEDAIERLHSLRSRLKEDIAAASPVFMDLLDSKILRYENTHRFYMQRDISRAQRLAERNPVKESGFTHSKHWGEEMLFFNAPEVFLAESGVSSFIKGREASLDSSLQQVPYNKLLIEVGDEKKPMAERKAVAQELVRRRFAEGGFGSLVRSLREADMAYTYQDTVEELAKVGPKAIPAVIEFINDPAHFRTDQKLAIWALVRIGVADQNVIQTLESISGSEDRSDLAKYAQEALRYLQVKSR